MRMKPASMTRPNRATHAAGFSSILTMARCCSSSARFKRFRALPKRPKLRITAMP
ncbi:hypothetical protein APX70_200485 [Pseudomonas syringae pv. maculicola]|uniref:Uncharacterized protein n=1 Tax=Pseudomonas syringae pv. maculicola TaxID=59511 RepID=A0A3M2UWZ2_PSEYM|nr:hypothetical protein APX70_200485 [Pseudomonas syringae pv. maculicola]